MIGYLRGSLIEKHPPHLLLQVGGIGYEITMPIPAFCQLPNLQTEVTLYTHLVIREDAHSLYGFTNTEDRNTFRSLIKVNGVGPKLALAILSGLEVSSLYRCITQSDTRPLLRIPGIGQKTAERLLIEMKNSTHFRFIQNKYAADSSPSQDVALREEAAAALVVLGYKPHEAKTAVSCVSCAPLTLEELIRAALGHAISG